MASTRSGVLCVGSIVVDLAKVIDAYPDQERITLISDVSLSTGGPALNLAVDLRRLGALFPLELAGAVGDDEHGRLVRDACAALGIDTSALRTVADVATSFTDAMVVRDGGSRTFFHHPGASALLSAQDVDVTGSRAKILHAGAPGLHPRMDAPRQEGGNGWAFLLQAAQSVGMRTTMELVSLPDEEIRVVALPCLPHLDENAFGAFKSQLKGDGVVLRSKTPDGAEQELWALLCVYHAIRELICAAAELTDQDPLRLSFIAALDAVRGPVGDPAAFPP